jgi:hypothetical protein
MNTLYHKVAVVSVCTALSFALVANKEAKAASFTLQPITAYTLGDTKGQDGVADTIFGGASLPVGIINGEGYRHEYRASYEFNLGNLSLDPNTISRVLFRVDSNTISSYARFSRLDAYGYTGNGQADVSDFGAGEFLEGEYVYSALLNPIPGIKPYFVFDVLPFISQNIKNNNTFGGFSLRIDNAYLTLNEKASLTIITADVAEPVPEPTTILTAAVALGWGGWLKRKKSSQQNKTTPQA